MVANWANSHVTFFKILNASVLQCIMDAMGGSVEISEAGMDCGENEENGTGKAQHAEQGMSEVRPHRVRWTSSKSLRVLHQMVVIVKLNVWTH